MMTGRFQRSGGVYALLVVAAISVSACQMPFGQNGASGATGGGEQGTQLGTTRLVERDVEVPEIFQVSEDGLWDGRPSLGGVWVAHPSATDPERVIIRNEANGRFVIGALFRRERDNPGPALQVSSDAAAALNMLAGAPTNLNVTALRREEVPEALPAPATTAPGEETATSLAAGTITAAPLDDPIEAAASALDALEAEDAAPAEVAAAQAPAPAADPAPVVASNLERPFIQIGIFSVQENANNTGQALRTAGMLPTIYDQQSNDRRFWRVVVGPAATIEERARLLDAVKDLGFEDAYFVTN